MQNLTHQNLTGSTTGNGMDNTDSTLETPANNKGNDVAIGDTVKYQIDATIPSYSKSYTRVKVNITDQLSVGLELKDNPGVVVTVGGTTATAGTDYTYTKGNPERGFTIAFDSDYALAHQGEAIVVTYEAVLTEDAATNFHPNTYI